MSNNKGNKGSKGNNPEATPTWADIKMGGWELTLFPVARKSKQGKKGVVLNETFAPFVLRVDGKAKGKHPLTAFEFLDIPNGKRDEMIVWASHFGIAQGIARREWIDAEYMSARDRIVDKLRKANKRTQKTIDEGLDVFIEKARTRAAEKFTELPEDINERNEKIAELEGGKAEGAEG